MRIDFRELKELTLPGMNGGAGTMTARMFMNDWEKVIVSAIHPGGSIGRHGHEIGDDINYVLSGEGTAICDGQEETLVPGVCHICEKGSEHSILNTGGEDLVLLTVVTEH